MRTTVPVLFTLALLYTLHPGKERSALGEPEPPATKRTPTERTFDGSSEDLKATTVVPGFATPLPERGNVVWCSTVEMAWQAVGRALGGPLEVPNGGPEVLRLNAAPRPELPESAHYVDGGRATEALIQRIERTMQARFGHPPGVDLRGLHAVNLGYAFLKAEVPFRTPYQQLPEGLRFRGERKNRQAVRAFGFEPGAPEAIRAQVRVLYLQEFEDFGANPRYSDFVLDLDATSDPFQVLVAVVPRRSTLEATWRDVLAHLDAAGRPGVPTREDSLAVPVTSWRIVHTFPDLTGRHMGLVNPGYEDQYVGNVMQIATFRLDEQGAAAESEAVGSTRGPSHRRDFYVNRPYLLAMRTRGSRRPFLALWIENAELLAEMPN